MNDEKYKELNIYLNDAFINLEKRYPYALNCMRSLISLNSQFVNMMKSFDYTNNVRKNYLNSLDVFDYARKIIESIDQDYLKLYDDLIDTGRLDFSYNNEYYDSHFRREKNINLININRSFNYDDVVSLVHEFIHYTNLYKGLALNNEIFSEFFSIYFEIYATNYMLKDNIPIEELDCFFRLRSTYNIACFYNDIAYAFYAYKKYGYLSDSSLFFLNKDFSITKDVYYKQCNKLLEYFRNIKKEYMQEKFDYEIDNKKLQCLYGRIIGKHFGYIMGTIFAFEAIKYCDIKDIAYVNKHIYDMELDDCFKRMNIGNKTPEEIFVSMKEFYNKVKTKRM